MAKITTTHLKCDVCGNESKPEEGDTPKGWIPFEIDDAFRSDIAGLKFLRHAV